MINKKVVVSLFILVLFISGCGLIDEKIIGENQGSSSYNTDPDPICVEPYSGMIIRENTLLCSGTYNLGNNGIIIESENIVLKCNSTLLLGNGSQGILINGGGHITVQECELTGWAECIGVYGSSGNLIKDNKCYDTLGAGSGIKLSYDSNSNKIIGNIIDISYWGINVQWNSHLNEIKDNLISGGFYGINVYSSDSTEIINNTITNYIWGVEIFSASFLSSDSTKIINNIIMDSIYYGIHVGDNTDNSKIMGNTITNSGLNGIKISDSLNNKIEGNFICYTTQQTDIGCEIPTNIQKWGDNKFDTENCNIIPRLQTNCP